ncbi:DUF6544 family protein [Hwangdonia seohaensis]|uniref:DUF6544 family protein n=1 Tax=Hwangdonia seohaensis TaxID=1240727 RepID=A0ABW3RFU6_9FLAO|nr:DUF6544 family protein [Hwangdonia seohaensis]
MNFIFGGILLIHALIHLMGFAKAFQLANINQLTQSISKPIGMLWFFTALLFVLSAVLFFMKKEWWFVVALVALIISQILIILLWKDAKYGTIPNIIILIVSISAFGNYQFQSMVEKESKQILQHSPIDNLPIISDNDIKHLPEMVRKWLQTSGVVGNEKIITVRLKQKGEMRTKPESKWMPFTATQHFNVENPAFIWTTKVNAMPIINMTGRDKLYAGEGDMLIKLASIFPVVNEGKNTKINQGAMVRYLAEMCWFPSAVLNDYIVWKPVDSSSAKATLTINDQSVSGVFTFSKEGDLVSFEAERYYSGKDNSKLEKWFVKMDGYKVFNGVKIPNKSSVTWLLKEGDFNWLNLEITELEYNIFTTY